jgi:hypothetical protein
MTALAHEWEPFFVAAAGVTAALAGLIFIAISIGLDHILETPGLDTRGLEAVGLLVGALVLSLAALMPGQPSTYFAIEAAIAGLIIAFLVIRSTLVARRIARTHPFNFGLKVGLAIVTVPPYLFAAATAAQPVVCLTWIGIGVIVGVVSACVDSWVLLVEIQRDRPRAIRP